MHFLVIKLVSNQSVFLAQFSCSYSSMAINISVQCNNGFLPVILRTVYTMRLTVSNPTELHVEVLFKQPMLPTKRFDGVLSDSMNGQHFQ